MKLTIFILLLLITTMCSCSPQSSSSNKDNIANNHAIGYEKISNDSLFFLFTKEVKSISPYYSTSSSNIEKMMKDTLCKIIIEMNNREIIGKYPMVNDYIYMILLKSYIHQRYCCGQGYTMYVGTGSKSDGPATDIITSRFFEIFSVDRQHQEMGTTGNVADYLQRQHLVTKEKPYFYLIAKIDSIEHSKGYGYSAGD